MTPSPFSRLASGAVSGLLSGLAQAISGVKTFAALIIASAGIQVSSLFATNGTGASDVGVKVGVSPADGSVNATAKLLSVRTGIGGTEVERYYFTKDVMYLGGGGIWSALIGSELYWRTGAVPVFALLPSGLARSGYGFDINPAFGAYLSFQVQSTGIVNQRGIDSSASPGAQTADRPIGRNAIAAGASSVVITNNLVTATSHIVFSPHARDATCKELIVVAGAGSFTVSGSANATAALPFSWRVATLLTS